MKSACARRKSPDRSARLRSPASTHCRFSACLDNAALTNAQYADRLAASSDMQTWLILLMLSGSVVTGTPQAAPAAAPDESAIIVEGARNRRAKITRFIRQLTPAPPRGQFSRLEAPVCPKVYGLADQQAKQIENRMRAVALEAGLDVGGPRCGFNVAVFVTADKPALIDQLYHHRAWIPEEWSAAKVRSVAADPEPVSTWQTSAPVWVDGMLVTERETQAPEVRGGGGKIHMLTVSNGLATKLRPSARLAIATSVVVVRLKALVGLHPTQLADYALMRALVPTEPAVEPSTDTILSIFNLRDRTVAPATLTTWDKSFLKAFYASTQTMYAEYQRAQMEVLMERDLDALASSKH
jgi:hypothetical protein